MNRPLLFRGARLLWGPPPRPLQSTRSSSESSRGKFHRMGCWRRNVPCIGKRSQLQHSIHHPGYDFLYRARSFRRLGPPLCHTLLYQNAIHLPFLVGFLGVFGCTFVFLGYMYHSNNISPHPPPQSPHLETHFKEPIPVVSYRHLLYSHSEYHVLAMQPRNPTPSRSI